MSSADRPAHPLLAAAGRALEAVLNGVLARETRLRERLAPLDGRAIELHWSAADLGLRLDWNDGRVRIGPRRREPEADLALSSTLAGLAALVLPRTAGAGVPAGRVRIAGDAELARRLGALFEEAGSDLEAALVRVFGLEAGTVVARALRAGFASARQTAADLAQDAADYARDEAGLVAASDQIADFARDVDTLRDDVERFARRLDRLREDAAR